jgi:small toxic polypeptide LdrA/B/C/D
LPLQQGGCMTLAQLGLLLWDDLAAPVIAGILVSIIVSWMDNRKSSTSGYLPALVAACARTGPQG